MGFNSGFKGLMF